MVWIRQYGSHSNSVDGDDLGHGGHGGGVVDGGGGHSMQTVYSYGGQAEGGDVDRDTLQSHSQSNKIKIMWLQNIWYKDTSLYNIVEQL